MNNIIIDEKALLRIRDFAVQAFLQERRLPEDTKNLQAYLLMLGLEAYLNSKGITPNFTVKTMYVETDNSPLDDMG